MILRILLLVVFLVGCAPDEGKTVEERMREDWAEGVKHKISYRASYKVIEIDENIRCVVTLDHHTTPTAIDCDWGTNSKHKGGE